MFEKCHKWIASVVSLLNVAMGRASASVREVLRVFSRPYVVANSESKWFPAAAGPRLTSQIPTCGFSFHEMPRSVNARHDNHLVQATGVPPQGSRGSIRCRASLAGRGVVRFLRPITVGPSQGPPRMC